MKQPDQNPTDVLALRTNLTFDELSELRNLAQQDGWMLEDYTTEVLRGHLYVTRYLAEGVRH